LSRPNYAKEVYLSARRGAWILPKYIFGMPIDRLPQFYLPLMRIFYTSVLKWMNFGDLSKYGLPKPDHQLLEAHPTVSQELPLKLRDGAIIAKPAIDCFEGSKVLFTDGTFVEADIIIYCTGYKISFPFFEKKFIKIENNNISLWKRMFKPGIPNLMFAGLCQPIGSIFPISECQGQLFANYINQKYQLPGETTMMTDMKKENKKNKNRYVDSNRHTIEVDFNHYIRELKKMIN
jgi:dimethylaniline monooxygenase (N-oxide forming)